MYSFKGSISSQHVKTCSNHTVKKVIFNKQLLDEVFVICRIINVEVRVISRAEGKADNSFRDIDNFAYHKNRVQ